MSYQFTALSAEYTNLLVHMKITSVAEVNATAEKLLKFIDEGRYKAACDATGVPEIVAAASFEREASSDFRRSAAQGDFLFQVSHDVPRGLGPYVNAGDKNPEDWKKAWDEAAIAAYKIDGLDQVGATNWSWEIACFKEELFNGFGPRMHGRHSGYLWAGSNIYTGGKYIADGPNGWSETAVDSQLGVIPIMFRMVELRPLLTLPIAYPSATTAPTPQAAPVGLRNAKALQVALNRLGANPPLDVDDNYGRMTRRAVAVFQQAHGLEVDGIAGTQTWLEITKLLAQAANPTPKPFVPVKPPIVMTPTPERPVEPSLAESIMGLLRGIMNLLRRLFLGNDHAA